MLLLHSRQLAPAWPLPKHLGGTAAAGGGGRVPPLFHPWQSLRCPAPATQYKKETRSAAAGPHTAHAAQKSAATPARRSRRLLG